MKGRITGKSIELGSEDVVNFFEKRAQKYNSSHPLTSVLYQDSNPALAEKRDQHEKDIVLPQLVLTGQERVLDVGCGIGRWANEFKGKICSYRGIDVSPGLIEIAKQIHKSDNFEFLVGGVEKIKEFEGDDLFDRVIISGLLIYLNDDQVITLFSSLGNVISDNALIYIREPLALMERLTLKNYWSEELSTEYNAIYRSIEELQVVLKNTLSISQVNFHPLYPVDDLNNRLETRQFYTVLNLRCPR